MKLIIVIALIWALIAAGTGQLPKIVHQVRIKQLQLLKEMQTKIGARLGLLQKIKRKGIDHLQPNIKF